MVVWAYCVLKLRKGEAMRTFKLKGQLVLDMTGVDLYFENVDMIVEFLIMCRFKFKTENFVCDKAILIDKFFQSDSGFGPALRAKCHDYNIKIVIIGDYYEDIHDEEFNNFKYSCNNGKHLFFVSSREEGETLLRGVM